MPDPRTMTDGSISLDKIDVHDHAALFFQTNEEKERCLAKLVRLACQRDEACIFVTGKDNGEFVMTVAANAGLQRESLSKNGRISLVDPREEIGEQAVTASLMLDMIGNAIDSALDNGFTAVRIFVDTERLRELLPENEIAMFESLSNELYEEKKALGFCLINATTDGSDLISAITTHPTFIIKGFTCSNHFFMPPEECSKLFGNPPSTAFILDKFLEIQMSELMPVSPDDGLRALNARLQGEVERRQMVEWALLRSENDYRAAMNAFSDMAVVTDKANKVLIVNDAFLEGSEALGYPGKIIGDDLRKIMPMLGDSKIDDYQEIFITGRPSSKNITFDIGGVEQMFEIRKVPIKDGDDVSRVLTMIRNITEHYKAQSAFIALKEELAILANKQAEEIAVLRERFVFEQEMRELIEGRLLSVIRVLEVSKVAMFIGDRDRQIVYANPACCRYVGYEDGKIEKVDFMDLFVPEERSAIQEIAKGLKDRNEVVFSANARMRDGSNRPSAVSLIKLDEADGYMLVIMTDGVKPGQRSGSLGVT